MAGFRLRQILLLLAVVGVLASSTPPAEQASIPALVPSLLAPRSALAQAIDGGSFGSAVPCLEAPDQFVTSCFANTLVSDTDSGMLLEPVASSDTALVRFNTGGKTPLANLGQIGAVYGMAYDDGSASGARRLLLGAFARRMTGFGPGGPGAIYQYNLASGAISLFAQVPGTTNRHAANDWNDDQIGQWVGKSSLGDLEIGPDGTTLFAMNLDTRQVERYSLLSDARLTPLSINFAAISADPAVQADLRPFALEFQPTTSASQSPYLFVGLVDSGERNPGTVVPTAYVIGLHAVTGNQIPVLAQPLGDAAIAPRFGDGVNAGQAAWNAWRSSSPRELFPMPLVADIQWSRDGLTMAVGLRDRNGDVYRTDLGDQWWRVQEQGDVLVYRAVGAVWQLQTRAVATPSDFFRDNYVGTSASTAHVENFMGALALTLSGVGSAAAEQLVGTAITPLQGGTSGANWHSLKPDQYDRQAAVELIPAGDLWKSATLGDLENLCTYAFVGDRVWLDANGNGVQDGGETGINGVLLDLLNSDGSLAAQATTDASGSYQFAVQPGRAYTIAVNDGSFGAGQPLYSRVIAPQNRGGSDQADSDADQILRRIDVPAQLRDIYDMSFDIGVMDASMANGIVGDRVWDDANSNGVQDGSERGVQGVAVRLLDTLGRASTQTRVSDSNGAYSFTNVAPGVYLLEFEPPAGINASPRDTGGDDTRDSDANAATNWRTPSFSVVADTANLTLDLGLIMGANVRVLKTGPAGAAVGSQASYTLTYINDGPAHAEGIVVRDTWPAGLSFLSASPAPASITGATATWSLGTLASGQSGSISVLFNVDANAPASGVNQATISTTTTNNNPADDSASVTTLFLRPNVYVQKTGPASATVGDLLSYSLAYGNNGSAPASGVSLLDTLPADIQFVSASPAPTSVSGQQLTWSLGTLSAGNSGTVTVVARSRTSTASGTAAVNAATISTGSPGDNPADNTSSATTLLQRADVRITKSSPTQFPVDSGQPATYYLDYANAGPAAALDVTLTDSVPPQLGGVTWSCASGCVGSGAGGYLSLNLGTLPAGATGRVVVVGTAQTGLAREDFVNTARISTSTPEIDAANNESSAPGAVWSSEIGVIKMAQPSVAAGDTFTATLVYKNAGPASAGPILLTDTLPNGATFVSSEPAPSSQNGQTLSWSLGALSDGQTGTIALVLRSDPTLNDGSALLNRADITRPTSDRDGSNQHAEAATLVVTRADVAVNKTAPGRVVAGEVIEYSLSYRNDGPSLARGAIITDTLPSELTLLSTNPPAAIAGATLIWSLGDLAPGASGSIAVRAQSQIGQTAPALVITNTAEIGSTTADPVPDNNAASATTSIETPDVWISKSAPVSVVAGAPFTTTLRYGNHGPARADGVVVRDILPAGLAVVSSDPPPSGPGLRWNVGSLPGGASGQITLVLRTATAAVSGTTYLNTAIIDAPSSPDRDGSNDIGTATSTVRPNADLSVVKTGPSAPVRSGSLVTYTLRYRNDGPSQAEDVRVSDTLPPGFTLQRATPAPTTSSAGTLVWALGPLEAGASGSISVAGTLFGAGTLTERQNVAVIGSPTTDDNPTNNTSTATTTLLAPDLALAKTDGLTQVQPGATLTYTLTARNSGPITATGVTLREQPPEGAEVLSREWQPLSDGAYALVLGDVGPGATITRTFVMRLPNPLPSLGGVENIAGIADDGSAGPAPTPADDTATDVDTLVAGRLGDTVWYDASGEGRQDAGEQGLGDVGLRLIDPATDRVLATTSTGTDGRYLFEGLRAGSYAVALAPLTTQVGPLRGFRHTTAPTPIGSIAGGGSEDLSLDIGLNNPGSTDVVLAYLRAERSGDDVLVRWRTLEELNTARFRVLRAQTDQLEQAIEIGTRASVGSAGGAYELLDAGASPNAVYWLVEVERDGAERVYGPIRQQAPTSTNAIYLPLFVK